MFNRINKKIKKINKSNNSHKRCVKLIFFVRKKQLMHCKYFILFWRLILLIKYILFLFL